MADISRLSRLIGAANRGVDISANTLVTLSIKVGGGVTNSELTKAILDNLINLQNGSDAGALHNHDGAYHTKTVLASTSNGQGASLIGIEDAAANYTSAHVEGALAEAALATAAVANDVGHLVTLSGRPVDSDNLGSFTGNTIPDNQTIKAALQSLESFVEALPDPMEYKGNWSASANTPTLADGVGNNGDVYYVTTAGSVNFGSGSISFSIGDRVVYSGADAKWQKWDTTDQVTSVNGMMGAVNLTTTDVAEGTNLYFTTARARTAAVVDSTAGNETDQAASVNALKLYVASQIAAGSESVNRPVVAGEGLAATTIWAVRWGVAAFSETTGRVYKADKDASTNDKFRVDGLVYSGSSISTAGPAIMTKLGKLSAPSHGLTIGLPVFLSSTGALTSTAPTADGEAVVIVGKVQDANTIDVLIDVVGVN